MMNLPVLRHRRSKLAAAAMSLAVEIVSPARRLSLAAAARAARCGQEELDLIADELYGLMGAAHSAQLQAVRRKYLPRLEAFAARHAADTYTAALRRA